VKAIAITALCTLLSAAIAPDSTTPFDSPRLVPFDSPRLAQDKPLVLRVKTIDGQDRWLTDYLGKVVLLNFWSTTCPPCRVETPWFVEFQERYRDRGFVILGVSVDDTPDRIKAFMQEYKVNYPMFDGRAADEDIQRVTGGMWGLPTTLMIGRDGILVKKSLGLVSKNALEKEIIAALARK
jgi:cytochrome c biogenesis protein CcmG/thiol:disulfide interchange protein DsbE